MRNRGLVKCTLSSYSWVSLCLWSGRTANRWRLLSCYAILQYQLYECVFGCIVKDISQRNNSALLWWCCLAQIGWIGHTGQYRPISHTALHSRDESDWTNWERDSKVRISQWSVFITGKSRGSLVRYHLYIYQRYYLKHYRSRMDNQAF